MNDETIRLLRDKANKSSKVVGWYPHGYDGTVRGPFGRWFTCTGGKNNGKQPKSIADIADDVEFAAVAMNHLVPLLNEVERLNKRIAELELTLDIEKELTVDD